MKARARVNRLEQARKKRADDSPPAIVVRWEETRLEDGSMIITWEEEPRLIEPAEGGENEKQGKG